MSQATECRYKRYRVKLGGEFKRRSKEYHKRYRLLHKAKYFVYKACHINGSHKHKDNIDSKSLANYLFWIWHKQRGKCALSGIKLKGDETTHLDHILPRCRGGSNHPSNLQFVDARVNKAKNGLTHNEFINLCQSVVNHTAKR